MNQSKILISLIWQKLALFFGVLLASFGLLFYRLNIPGLLSSKEVSTYNHSRSLNFIIHHPINAPYYLVEHYLTQFHNSIIFARATSAIFGMIIILLVFFILKFWLSIYYAVIGSLIFASTSWYLHTARFDSPNILLIGVLAPLACGIWLKHSNRVRFVLLICSVVVGLTLYVPGLIWFILIGAIGQRRIIIHELMHVPKWVPIAAIIIFLLLVTPLLWSFVQVPSTMKLILGVPVGIDWGWRLLLNLARVPVEIFVRGPLNPSIWLGRIPVLNIFESLMLVLGAYSFWLKRSLDRTKVLVVGLVISLALITFNGATEITLILPFLYMMVAAGVVYMWDLWHSVFPTNPVAKSAGILILGVAIIFSCGYHAREYFVAWPNSPPTNAAYTQKLPEI
jgi:hypothetical protein